MDRVDRLAAILLAVLTALYLAWTWSDQLASFDGDSALYVLMAQAYAPFGPPDPVAAGFAAESSFPPLYPLLLALTGGADDLRYAHAAAALCLIGAFAALYAYGIAAGLGRMLALGAVFLFAIAPGTCVRALYVHSESLYVALSLAALTLLLRGASTGRAPLFWLGAAAIAGACLTRSAGIALVPALLISLWQCRPRGWGWTILIAVGPPLAWSLAHKPLMGYGESMTVLYGGKTAVEIAELLLYQASAFGSGLAANFLQTRALAPLLGALGLVALATATWRFAKGLPDAWYSFAYIAMMVLWPFPDEAQRFAWVIAPLALAYALLGAYHLVSRLPVVPALRQAMAALAPLALFLVFAPGFTLMVDRRLSPLAQRYPGIAQLPEWYDVSGERALTMGRLHLDVAAGIRALAAQVPEGECLYSVKPSVVQVLGGRSAPLLPNYRTGDAEFDAFLRAGTCRYFLGLALVTPAYWRPFYPIERLAGRIVVEGVHQTGDGTRVAVLARLP